MGYLALALASNLGLTACDSALETHESKAQSAPTIVISAPSQVSEALNEAAQPIAPGLSEPYCARGYRSSGVAAIDVLRLSALCVGSNGLQASESIAARSDPTGAGVHRFELEAGDCVWAVAAGEPKGAALRVRWSEGGQLIADCDLVGAGWCPRQRPLCASRPSSFEVALDLPDAEVAVGKVWRRTAASQRRAAPSSGAHEVDVAGEH